MDLIEKIFQVTPAIRYVALYRNGQLQSRQRGNVADASSSESDRYEELFVNPTLLTLARQRGEVDCGGARFVVVGYGNFHQLVLALPSGHASVCFELRANPLEHYAIIHNLCMAAEDLPHLGS